MKNRFAVILSTLAVISLSACSGMKAKSEAPSTTPTAATASKTAEPKHATKAMSPIVAVCKNGKDERKLEVINQASGCELHYTKGGNAEVIATSVKGNEHCKKISQRIQEKLTAAGFQCQ